MTELWIALIVAVIILVLKFTGGWKKVCGPKCRLPQKPIQTKRDFRKEREEIKKRIERQKGKDPKDLNLFSDFIDKGKKEKK